MEICEKNLSFLVMEEEWQAPYLHRERNEKGAEILGGVGCYPNDDNMYTDIVLNLQADVDENNRIINIDYYKVRDLSCGVGRPDTRDLKLTPYEKNKFAGILNDATISRADKTIDSLLKKAEDKPLPNGWKIQKYTLSAVVFHNIDGREVTVSIQRILKALEISYSYIEILSNPDFWDANKKVLKQDDKEPLLSLFSLVDTSDYYLREQLIAEADERAYKVEKDYCYRLLQESVEKQNIPLVKKYAKFAKEKLPYGSVLIPPLYTAVKKGNAEIVKILIKNGASVNEHFQIENEWTTPITACVETQNDLLFKLCINKEFSPEAHECTVIMAEKVKRIDYVIALLKKGVAMCAGQETLDLGIDCFKELVKYDVVWMPMHLSAIYDTGDIKLLKQMLKALKTSRHESSFYRSRLAVEWIISTGNISLMQYCSNLNYELRNLDEWLALALLPKSWSKYIPKVYCDSDYYKKDLQKGLYKAINNHDAKAGQLLITNYGAEIDLTAVTLASRIPYNKYDEATIQVIIDNFIFPEQFYKDRLAWDKNCDLQWLIQALGRLNNKSLWYKLIKRMPELFSDEVYSKNLLFYCTKREMDNEVREAIMKRLPDF